LHCNFLVNSVFSVGMDFSLHFVFYLILYISALAANKRVQYTINTKIQPICKIIKRSLVFRIQNKLYSALRLQKQQMLQRGQGKLV